MKTLFSASALILAGSAAASVVVDFDCRALVVGVGEYHEGSGVLDLVVRVVGVNEALTGHNYETFLENYGGFEMEIPLSGVDPEAAASIAGGWLIDILYHHVSGIMGGEGDFQAYSSEEWRYLGRAPLDFIEEVPPVQED